MIINVSGGGSVPRHGSPIGRHQALVAAVAQNSAETTVPFALDCEKRLESLGGWKSRGIRFASSDVRVTERFRLPNSRCSVTVLDDVLEKETCKALNELHEEVGFAPVPSLLVHLAKRLEHEGESEEILQRAYEQGKNASELVQLESSELANYLWQKLRDYLPDEHEDRSHFTGGLYEKCGIIPVFRFMRYQKGQGFKPHHDPSRDYVEYEGSRGIFKSFFTVALYLNDQEEFQGGELNFVRMQLEEGRKSYESQASVNPKVGRCVLFNHKELHEGGGVEAGTKYMCQCDVLYKRVADL